MPSGIYERTEEIREKTRNTLTGTKATDEARANMSEAKTGEKHWNWGGKASDETREKQSKAQTGKLGDKCSAWKDGRMGGNGDYVYIYIPEHPKANGNHMAEHRLIVEKCLGRYLTKEEEIHHINEIRDDNRLENLYLFPSKGEHMCFHHSKNKPILISNICIQSHN